jgi:hypothetical protein
MSFGIYSDDYDKNYKALSEEQAVIDMANDISNYSHKQFGRWIAPGGLELTHEGGHPTFEFMMLSNKEYHARGGQNNESIGAVAHAIINLLEAK